MNDLIEDLRAAMWSVWHRRWIALAVAWGVCLLGWVVIAMIPNTYESKARVYVDVEDVLSKQLGIAGDGKEEIMRVRQTLSSAKNLEKVITATRLGEGVTERGAIDAMIGELEKKVKVTSEQDNLFEITAEIGRGDLSDAENAVLARDVVQKLLDILREEHVVGNRAGIFSAIGDLDRQLEERKRELETAEQRRLAFEAQYPDLVGGTDSLSSKVQASRSDLRAVEADLAAAQSALAAITGQLSGTPRSIIGGPQACGRCRDGAGRGGCSARPARIGAAGAAAGHGGVPRPFRRRDHPAAARHHRPDRGNAHPLERGSGPGRGAAYRHACRPVHRG